MTPEEVAGRLAAALHYETSTEMIADVLDPITGVATVAHADHRSVTLWIAGDQSFRVTVTEA